MQWIDDIGRKKRMDEVSSEKRMLLNSIFHYWKILKFRTNWKFHIIRFQYQTWIELQKMNKFEVRLNSLKQQRKTKAKKIGINNFIALIFLH